MVLGLFLGGDEFLPRFYSFSRLQLEEIGPYLMGCSCVPVDNHVMRLDEFHISIAL